jgi:hypothetical protein
MGRARPQTPKSDHPMPIENPEAPVMGAEGNKPAVKPAPEPTIEELREQLDVERAEKERLKVANKKVSDEDSRKRRRLEELEKADEERQSANLGEVEKLKRAEATALHRAEAAEKRAEESAKIADAERMDREVERCAQKLNFKYPHIVPSLVDRRSITVDEDTGRLLGVKEAVDRIAKEMPDLLNAGRAGGTPARDGDGPRRPLPPPSPPARNGQPVSTLPVRPALPNSRRM